MPQNRNQKQELSLITIWSAVLAAAALLTGLLYWLWKTRVQGDDIEPIHIDLSFVRPPAAPAPAPAPVPDQTRFMSEPEAAPVSEPVGTLPSAAPDDLTVLKGIGPKIAGVLKAAGIDSYARLAQADPEALQRILLAANFRLADPASWPEQARLAAAGRWDEMRTYVASLRAGQN